MNVASRKSGLSGTSDIWSLTEASPLDVERCATALAAYSERMALTDTERRCLPMELAARWFSARLEGMAKVPEEDRRRFFLRDFLVPLESIDRDLDAVITRALRRTAPPAGVQGPAQGRQKQG